jgi:hypothetical protein
MAYLKAASIEKNLRQWNNTARANESAAQKEYVQFFSQRILTGNL